MIIHIAGNAPDFTALIHENKGGREAHWLVDACWLAIFERMAAQGGALALVRIGVGDRHFPVPFGAIGAASPLYEDKLRSVRIRHQAGHKEAGQKRVT